MAQATHDIPNNPATPHKNFGFNMITAPTSPVQLRGNKKRALGRRREAADAEREAKRRRLAWGERLKSEYEDELEFLAEIVLPARTMKTEVNAVASHQINKLKKSPA